MSTLKAEKPVTTTPNPAAATKGKPVILRPIAARAVADAIANACTEDNPIGGVHETAGNNLGKMLEYYKTLMGYGAKEPLPWCAIFGGSRYLLAEMRLNAAGQSVKLPEGFPRNSKQNSAACAAYKEWAKKTGRWRSVGQVRNGTYTPVAGDIVIFDWDDRWGNDHFGIVRGYDGDDKVILTVEGNTRAGYGVSRESQKGDGVWCKRQTLSALGVGGGVIVCNF